MRVVIVLVAALTGGTVCAQQAQNAFSVHPYLTRGDLAASRFWTRSRIALVTLDGATKAADSYATRRNMDVGGEENDALARPFVHTTPVQIVATGALFGAEVATAYVLHRRHHDNLGRAILIEGAVVNGLGAAVSCKNRSWGNP